ncbi:MAG: hypothetical protein COC24_002200 [Alphaproteobacteria bacterium]|nr:hypothetical protein [Alphaproteobacteria bacterium]
MKKPTKRIAPISVRVTESERVLLEDFSNAVGMSISAYIKWRVFAPDRPKPKSRCKAPVKDFTALGSILGELGQSQIAPNLAQLAEAAKSGSLPITPETESKLVKAAKDISHIRNMLIQALGLQS